MVVPEPVIVGVLWTIWCALHSLMIDRRITAALRRRWGGLFRFHRLVYNALSALTLVPVLAYTWQVRGDNLWCWQGLWRVPQMLLLAASMALFYAGGRRYDLRQFSGLRQIRSGTAFQALTASGHVDAAGVLGVVRHPWYAAGILLVWARDVAAVDLAANGVITAYMVLGSWLEERKLTAEFGGEYTAYQAQVPMLVPWRWLAGAWRSWRCRCNIRS